MSAEKKNNFQEWPNSLKSFVFWPTSLSSFDAKSQGIEQLNQLLGLFHSISVEDNDSPFLVCIAVGLFQQTFALQDF